MGGIYYVAVETGSGAMIYIHTRCIKDWFKHSKVEKVYTQTHWHTDRKEVA
jgi:hypothetical protein